MQKQWVAFFFRRKTLSTACIPVRIYDPHTPEDVQFVEATLLAKAHQAGGFQLKDIDLVEVTV